MIQDIQAMGPLISDCTLAGDTKADDVFPAHPNGIPVSQRRWVIVYATRGYRFMDDDRSIVWQLRQDAPDGPVLKEGFFSQAVGGWNPKGGDRTYFKQHGHPVLFGVPKGACIRGKGLPHDNLFVAKWRVIGIPETTLRYTEINDTIGVEWLQFRLNDREDDLEIVEPARPLRQKGCERGADYCSPKAGAPPLWMNQTFVQAVPCNDDATEWADVNSFEGGRIAALRYRYHPGSRRYEWVETGPMAGGGEIGLFEASLLRGGAGWVIAARCRKNGKRQKGSAWLPTDDPFASVPAPIYTDVPQSDTPIPVYRCADGVIRLFANDHSLSAPPRGNRNPLRCWDIDPATFAASNQRVIYDTFAAGLPLSAECNPGVDMAKLLPHLGGRVQYLVHRLRTSAVDLTIPLSDQPVLRKVLATPREKQCVGVYYEKLTYTESFPAAWSFE